MDTFPSVFPGMTVVFADITDRLVRVDDNKRTLHQWRATHPAALLSVASTSLKERKRGREQLLEVDHTRAKANVSLYERKEGITINESPDPLPVRVAVAHIKLMFSVTKRPVSISIDEWLGNTTLLADFLASLHAESHDSPVAEVKCLKVSLIDHLFDLHDRLNGKVVEPLRHLKILDVESLSSGKTLNSIGVVSLEELRCGEWYTASLLRICGMQSLRKVYIAGCVEIIDRDIEVLSELRQLRALTILSCDKVTTLAPFKDHLSLHSIKVGRSNGLKRVEALTTIPTLRKVHLGRCQMDPDEMSRCVRGFKNLEKLELYILIMADVLTVSIGEFWNLRSLSLVDATIKNFEWIAKAPYLTYLSLVRTNITGKDLAEVCGSLFYLEELYVQYCENLKTSLSFLLPMEHIRKVCISNYSLKKNHVISLLGKGVVEVKHSW